MSNKNWICTYNRFLEQILNHLTCDSMGASPKTNKKKIMKDHKGNLTLGYSKTKLDHNALAVAY